MFTEFFHEPLKQAIHKYTQDLDIQAKFLSHVREGMENIFRLFEFEPESESALSQHVKCLERLWPHMSSLKSFKSCLSCLMFSPEKVMHCGHAICNICVRRLGKPSKEHKHSFVIECCPLCGFVQPKEQRSFTLIPPTAGIRVLCLDGGGVRGVIPLVFMNRIERELGWLGSPVSDLYDYVCGTSAGMRWQCF